MNQGQQTSIACITDHRSHTQTTNLTMQCAHSFAKICVSCLQRSTYTMQLRYCTAVISGKIIKCRRPPRFAPIRCVYAAHHHKTLMRNGQSKYPSDVINIVVCWRAHARRNPWRIDNARRVVYKCLSKPRCFIQLSLEVHPNQTCFCAIIYSERVQRENLVQVLGCCCCCFVY